MIINTLVNKVKSKDSGKGKDDPPDDSDKGDDDPPDDSDDEVSLLFLK